ncbi:MAG: hypothetical protein QF797_03425 [Alphaproteobacteria bacterium]|nr:hypothetical protein [Alphaproteobacteria bacterium]
MSTLANIALFDPRSAAAVKPAARPAGARFDDLLGRHRPRFRHAQDDDPGIRPQRRRSDAATGGAKESPGDGLAREAEASGERANDNRPEASRQSLSDSFAERSDRFVGYYHFDAGFMTQVLSQEVMPEDNARGPRHNAAGSAAYRDTTLRTDAYLVPDQEELLVT